MHRVAKDGYLFVTWANHHYTDFALTWVQHMKLQNITNFMVGAMDDKILASLARRSIPTFSMQSGELARAAQQHLQQQQILTALRHQQLHAAQGMQLQQARHSSASWMYVRNEQQLPGSSEQVRGLTNRHMLQAMQPIRAAVQTFQAGLGGWQPRL